MLIAHDDPTNTASTSENRIYLIPASATSRVLLKVVPVLLLSKFMAVETYALLDDGAQRTMIFPTAVQMLQLRGEPETLALRTVRHNIIQLQVQD